MSALLFNLLAGIPGRADDGVVAARYLLVAYDPLNDQTTTLARAIVDRPDASCPVFELVGEDGGATTELATAIRQNPDREAFPVTVCEAVVPPGHQATVGGVPLPVFKPDPEHVVIVGDSGCNGGDKQNCDYAWAFPGIADHAAANRPDLVIHVGDWNYRGTQKTTVDGEATYDSCLPDPGKPWVDSTADDTWQTWSADVFMAAAPLMAVAPWIVARGNHELCSRGGRGWFYFLDPRSTLLDPYRAVPTCNGPTVQTDPYALDLGNLQIVVFDSANACDEAAYEDEMALAYQARIYARLFDSVATLIGEGDKPVWLLTHHPIWSAARYAGEPDLVAVNLTLQNGLRQSLAASLPAAVKLVLSGHVHEFQSITFDSDRPPQLMVGNSGVKMDANLLDNPYVVEIDGQTATGLALSARNGPDTYGYLEARIGEDGTMAGSLYGFAPDGMATGEITATCALPVREDGLCRLTP